ncbi:Zn-ribbon domain-containing OB-fold protein [Amycolatopsis sp.]|uniref:Zn-ribbon domain-containing OB-fold protein n=1 Tax=Amycolatopsis sp. TaxID=37632 RepID=UPI002B73F2F8|nr:OB-fold domain-containing protein [Amycolatopsis sp.]HVV08053.1 OB-fold domain-containing protein [Amycolatopsis sp.]
MSTDWLLDDSLAPSIEDEALGELYRGAARGELVLPFCSACELPLEPEQLVCDGCGATGPVWRPVPPRGRVHTATVVHRLEPGLVRTAEPYPVADVELASGHRLVLTAVTPGGPPSIGDPVSIGFRELGGVAVPAFEVSVAANAKESR